MPTAFARERSAPGTAGARGLLLGLLRRDLKDRYAGTVAGLGWALLQPAMMLALYAFVFAFIFRVRLPGAESALAYVVFVAATLWPWFMLQEGVMRAMSALRAQATLVRKTTLPRDIPVTVAVLGSAAVQLAGYLVVLLCLQLAGANFKLSGFPLWLVLLMTLLSLILACSFLASLAQLVWRDLEHVVQPIFMIVFYATPILYPLSLVPAEMRTLLQWNPLAWWVERLRAALLDGAMPSLTDVLMLLAALGLCWLCRRVYLRVAVQAEDLL
jgi:lipopolysaccharide transport system permease protein